MHRRAGRHRRAGQGRHRRIGGGRRRGIGGGRRRDTEEFRCAGQRHRPGNRPVAGGHRPGRGTPRHVAGLPRTVTNRADGNAHTGRGRPIAACRRHHRAARRRRGACRRHHRVARRRRGACRRHHRVARRPLGCAGTRSADPRVRARAARGGPNGCGRRRPVGERHLRHSAHRCCGSHRCNRHRHDAAATTRRSRDRGVWQVVDGGW